MQLFHKLFGPKLKFEYDCFDRIVLNGYLSFMTREQNVIYFFHDIGGIPRITDEALRQRTNVYQAWVESYARNHAIPIPWNDTLLEREATLAAALRCRERRRHTGVYYIIKSMEQGTTYRLLKPKFTTSDPNYMILRKHRSRYTHYYFYILDPIAGPMALRVGSFLPFPATAYLNGHEFIARRLTQQNVQYRKSDNAFLAVADPLILQTVADGLNARTLQQRVDYWVYVLGPKFSARERARASGLRRFWSISQVEFCRNFIFKSAFPIQHIFKRSCDLGMQRLTADRLGVLFGHKIRRRFRGKLQTVMERVDQGLFVVRAYWKNSFLKQYHKVLGFLRNEVVSNNLYDFGLKKGLEHLDDVRNQFKTLTARYADFQAETLNVHGELDIFRRLARPVMLGKSKIAGIKLENERTQRLLEVLLRQSHGQPTWNTRRLHEILCATFRLDPNAYRLSQLRYDLRKLRAHGLLERDNSRYAYRLTPASKKAALLMTLFRQRVYGPISAGTFLHRPDPGHIPNSKFERLYHKIDRDIDKLMDLLAA